MRADTHDGPEQIAPLQRPDTLMQLSRSSILEVHLVPHGRAIHFGTKGTNGAVCYLSAFGGKAHMSRAFGAPISGHQVAGCCWVSPAREHPLRTRFANISLRRAEFRKANFDGAARGQLCDRNVRDDFTQPSNSPDHGIKPVWRAINGAVPLAAEGHHFALELIEPAAMQDTLLFI